MKNTSRAQALKLAVAYYYVKKRYSCHSEVGLDKRGRFRADVLAMTIHGYLVIVEVKSSVADFKSDKKAHNYLEYANKVYFAFAPDTWDKVRKDVPKEFGVMVLNQKGRMRVARKAKHRDLEPGVQKKVCLRMAYRGGWMSGYNTHRTFAVTLPKE